MNEVFSYNGYSIRPTAMEDYAAMEALHENVYQKKINKGFYANKYSRYDISLPSVISFVAVDQDNQVIACSSLVPLKMQQQHQTFIGAQWADAMVHTAHQKKGLGFVLCSSCMEKAKEAGISTVFCLPVEATFNLVTTKLQHELVSSMLCYIITISTLPIASLAAKLKMGNLYTRFTNLLFAKYRKAATPMPSAFSSNYLTVLRDEQFMAYKEKAGSYCIRVAGSIVWLNIKQGALFIGDMVSPTEASFKQAITILKKSCFCAGIKSIIFQTTRGSRTEAHFSKHYPSMVSYKICAASFREALNVHKLQLTYGDADNF